MTYREMASLYDKLMEHAPYDQWYTFTKEIFQRSGKNIETIADLGCGTGEITTRLAQEQFQLYGIDYSADMLVYADQKASMQGLNIQWLQQDLRQLTGLKNLDAAISYCDVINYVTDLEDVRVVFENVANSLKPGGLFIFDVHSIFHVQHHLIDYTFADVSDDFSYIWFCSSGDDIGEMHHDLTFFSLDGEKYSRFNEYHHQKTYPIDTYQQILLDTGFKKAKLYSDFSLENKISHENAERIFFVTEKRSR